MADFKTIFNWLFSAVNIFSCRLKKCGHSSRCWRRGYAGTSIGSKFFVWFLNRGLGCLKSLSRGLYILWSNRRLGGGGAEQFLSRFSPLPHAPSDCDYVSDKSIFYILTRTYLLLCLSKRDININSELYRGDYRSSTSTIQNSSRRTGCKITRTI